MNRRYMTPVSPDGAVTICFNDHEKIPTPFTASLFVDAGIFIAIVDQEDVWHRAVAEFFECPVFDPDSEASFFATADVMNECLHRLISNYESRTRRTASPAIRKRFAGALQKLIRDGFLEMIDVGAQITENAIERWSNSSYGAKDAFHISCQLAWELDLITVDHRLMEEMERDPDFKDRVVYYPSLSLREKKPYYI